MPIMCIGIQWLSNIPVVITNLLIVVTYLEKKSILETRKENKNVDLHY